MFSEEDKAFIIETLSGSLSLDGSPRAAIAGPFANTSFAVNLIANGTVLQIATDAVRLCILDGWNNEPTWMQRLLDIFNLRQINPKVNEIWERSKHKPPPGPDPYTQTVLNNITPFINRGQLRNHMTRLSEPISNSQPILVVNGSNKSGKSYSTNYIDHFSNHKNTVIACSATLDQEIGLDLTAEKLAKDLVSQMGLPINDIPGSETNMRAYAESLANWVLNNGAQLDDNRNCWLVLDNFKGSFLHQSTAYFLTALSSKITKGMYAKKCRLILIGVDRSMLTVEPGRLNEEIIQQCSKQDVIVTINEILSRAIQPINPATMVDFILDGLPNDATKMAILNARLRSLLHAINRLNGPFGQHPDYETFLLAMLTGLPDTADRNTELDGRLDDLIASNPPSNSN